MLPLKIPVFLSWLRPSKRWLGQIAAWLSVCLALAWQPPAQAAPVVPQGEFQCVATGQPPPEQGWQVLPQTGVLPIVWNDWLERGLCHVRIQHPGQTRPDEPWVLVLEGSHQSDLKGISSESGPVSTLWTSTRAAAMLLPPAPGALYLQVQQQLPLNTRLVLQMGGADDTVPALQLDYNVRIASVTVMLIMAVFSGLFALALRDRTIGWFSTYALGAAGVWAYLSGFALHSRAVTGLSPDTLATLMPLVFGMTLVSGLWMARGLCNLEKIAPLAARAVDTVAWAVLGYFALSVLPAAQYFVLDHLKAVVLCALLFMLVPGTVALARGEYRAGLYYMVGWLPSIVTWVAMLLAWVPLDTGQDSWTTQAVQWMQARGSLPDWLTSPLARQVALVAEILIFAVALADRAMRMRMTHERELTHDPITQTFNREGLGAAAENWLAPGATSGTPITLAIYHLQRFGHINQTLGYEAGDATLHEVARRLREGWGPRALVARVGSNTFAALAPQPLAEDKVRTLTESINRLPLHIGGDAVDISLCTGLLHHIPDGTPLDQLLRRAEVALRVAKQDRLVCVSYQQSLEDRRRFQLSLMSALRDAIQRNELQLALQPKVCTRTGEALGAEALLRWQHPEHGFIPPLDFLPFAEQTGLITEVTQWVLEQAMRLSVYWEREQLALQLSVNISAADLGDAQFVQRTAALLASTGARPERLCLEITESEVMRNPEQAMSSLQGLRQLGLNLSIDDFGTGNSSLAYLQRMPVQELKVDRSFVRDARHNERARLLMGSIVQMAHQLDLHVTAEGVENQQEWDCVAQAGCDEVQGYMVSRPMPIDDFHRWMASRTPSDLITAPAPLA